MTICFSTGTAGGRPQAFLRYTQYCLAPGPGYGALSTWNRLAGAELDWDSSASATVT